MRLGGAGWGALLGAVLVTSELARAEEEAIDAVEVFEVTGDATNTGIEVIPLPEKVPSAEGAGDVAESELFQVTPKEALPVAEPVVEINGVRQKPSWSYAGAVDAGVTYDSNIFIQNADAESDLILSLSPWIGVGWGDFRENLLQWRGLPSRFHEVEGGLRPGRAVLFGRYMPTLTAFLDHSDETSLDHDVWLHAGVAFAKLTLGADVRLQTLSAAEPDLGDRADRTVTSAKVTANYEFSAKTSADAALAVERRDYDAGQDSTEASLQVFVDRKAFNKVRLAFGGGVGFIDSEEAPEQTYEQALARVRYLASRKLELAATGGVSFRQSDGGEDQVNPVFTLAAMYAPIQAVRFSVEGSRRTTASAAFDDGVVERTGVQVSMLMQVRRRYFLTLKVGYEHDEYDQGIVVGDERTDDRILLGAGIAVEVTPWLSIGLDLSYQDSDSSVDAFSYERTLVELSARARF